MPGFHILHYLPECSNSYPLSQNAIQSSHSLWSPSPTTLNLSVSEPFPVSWLFISGGQSIGASTSTSALPMNIQGLFPLGLTGLISLLSKGLSSIPPAPQFKSINSSALSLLHGPAFTSVHDYWKNQCFD